MVNQHVQSKLKALRNKRKAKGATIIEVIIFMGIAAFILVMAMQGGTQAKDNQKVSAEVQNLNMLVTSIRQMFGTQRVYTGLNNTVLLQSSNFPEQMRVPNEPALIANSWETDGVKIDPAKIGGGTTDEGFTITYNKIPKEACVDIIDRTYRHFISVTVGGGAAADDDIVARHALCAADTNTIVFTDR